MVIGQRIAMWPVWLVLASTALPCASAQRAGTTTRSSATATEPCFNVANVDSFSALHPSYVLVRQLDGKQYLLTLDSVHTGLPFATGIRISGGFTWICSGTGARITFRDAGRPTFCRILRVERVASRAAAEQLVQDRTTSQHKE